MVAFSHNWSLKNTGNSYISLFYGLKLGERLSTIKIQHVDGIVPVLLHSVKFRERGYNQVEWIAKGLGEALNLPVWSSLIKRVKYTVSQTTLD